MRKRPCWPRRSGGSSPEQGVLICGGGTGVMEAASRGASRTGGLVVGILPSENESTANPYVGIPIVRRSLTT